MLPAAVVAAIVLVAAAASAQDLEPRAYASSPVGATFLVLGLSHSSGGVVVDPTLPVSDIEASINGVVPLVVAAFGSDPASSRILITLAAPVRLASRSGVQPPRRVVAFTFAPA